MERSPRKRFKPQHSITGELVRSMRNIIRAQELTLVALTGSLLAGWVLRAPAMAAKFRRTLGLGSGLELLSPAVVS